MKENLRRSSSGLLAGLALLCAAGCSSTSGRGGGLVFGGKDNLEELHLFGMPTALSSDRLATPDGFAVRVFASSRKQAKGVAIRSGTLEILMFDGTLGNADPRLIAPVRVWSYSDANLVANLISSSVGIGYEFVLRWGAARPVTSRISVVARLTPPTGPPLYSAPSVISVTAN